MTNLGGRIPKLAGSARLSHTWAEMSWIRLIMVVVV